jgi:hypothetical protein
METDMSSRHHLLAEIEEKRRREEEQPLEVLSWDLVEAAPAIGHNPYDNPGTGKEVDDSSFSRKRRRPR